MTGLVFVIGQIEADVPPDKDEDDRKDDDEGEDGANQDPNQTIC